MEKLDFLKSVRFWKLFVVALLVSLEQQGVITGELLELLARLIEIVLGGSVVVRTVDRFSETLASAKK